MGKRVKAIQTGFYGGSRRRPGAVFELADGEQPGAWMELLEESAPVPQAPRARRPKTGPETLSELTPPPGSDLV